MAFPSSRLSIDSFVSPLSSPRPKQNPFSSSDVHERSTQNHPSLRRGSTTGSVSSTGGALGTPGLSQNTFVGDTGQNAISVLLRPPIVHTGTLPYGAAPASSTFKPPSSRDIPPVTLTNIPHVESSAFAPYLSQVGSLYDAFQQAKERRRADGLVGRERKRRMSKDDKARPPLEGRFPSEVSESYFARRQSVKQSPQAMSSATFSEGYPISGTPKGSGHIPAPLSTIPSVYFEENFHLENPRTFDVVSERSHIVRRLPGTPREEPAEADAMDRPENFAGVSRSKPLATNAVLQEKLSWYMDTVELHLINSISSASTSFFAALGSLRALYDEAANSVKQIRDLRSQLAALDQDMALEGLKIVKMQRRKDNLRKLGEAVDQVKEVVDGIARCRQFISSSQFEQAIDTVEDLEALMSGEPSAKPRGNGPGTVEVGANLVELRNVKALSGVSGDLNNFKVQIGKAFESQFVNGLIEDLRQHMKSVAPADTLRRWSKTAQRTRNGISRTPSMGPIQQPLEDELRARLHSFLAALERCQHTASASGAYSDAILREVKNVIRSHLPSSDDDDTESVASISTRGGRQRTQQEKSSILARNLRSLEPDEAAKLLTLIYVNISEMLRRVAVQVKMLLDITSVPTNSHLSAPMKSPLKSPSFPTLNGYLNIDEAQTRNRARAGEEENHQPLDVSNVLGQVVDVAQTQITKILKVRADQSIHLPLSKFLRYFALNRLFADECETISGRGGSTLKSIVNGHIKDFVTYFGNAERQALAQIMDADQWDAADFGDSENQRLSRIIESSTKDVETWTISIRLEDDEENTATEATGKNGPNGVVEDATAPNGAGGSGGKDKVRRATIDEQRFILPKSALAVLKGVENFQRLIAAIPSMNQEVSSNLLDYLKLFNSRSCQLILGAGATRSAGLKNITTKHLALASQALGFFTALIPYVREFVRRHATPAATSCIFEFDKVKRLLQEHQTGIQDKLVEIMSARSRSHVNAMKKINWDDDVAPSRSNTSGGSSSSSSSVNPYMETLTKETSTLHRVLSKHLPDVAVKMVMGPIFASYKEQWGQGYKETTVTSRQGKESMLRDAEAFCNKLGKLDGFDDTGSYVLGIVREKLNDERKSVDEEEEEVQPQEHDDGDVKQD